KRYKALIGKSAVIPLINKSISIIGDDEIKIDFGTGALKVTPAHDPTDYEIGLRNALPIIESIDRNGRMVVLAEVPEKYHGMKINEARKAVVADLGAKLIKTEPLVHTISVCYRCGTTIEPMLTPQWYIKTKTLAKPAIDAVKLGKIKIVPKKRFEKMFFDWMENILDWNISRQIVWGPRIPVWYCLECNPEITLNFIDKDGKKVVGSYEQVKSGHKFEEIKSGLQSLSAPVDSVYSLQNPSRCLKCTSENILQETDTFDTWFLSSQWPLNALGYPDSEDFKYFYPTSVMDTLWDILFFWVARMMMMGIYRAGEIPFKVVHLHARVVDKFGQKMSKSKGNTINPLEMVEKYGADALRMSLVYGVAPAADIVMSDDKVRSMRNFANKIWNMARFFLLELDKFKESTGKELDFYSQDQYVILPESDKKIIDNLNTLIKSVDENLAKYRFADAAEGIYHFMWDELASKYLEELKSREDKDIALSVFRYIFLTCLKLLHPFMPFITEEIWGHLPKKTDGPLIISTWPKL
ncbi:valine--tRNA ligase, partial [candidate division WWE3 bacterium CG08_land_8_20_14_0_20_41_10]